MANIIEYLENRKKKKERRDQPTQHQFKFFKSCIKHTGSPAKKLTWEVLCKRQMVDMWLSSRFSNAKYPNFDSSNTSERPFDLKTC